MQTRTASYDFSDCVAVVTGGSQGIGAAIVYRLREAGATVCVWDRAPEANDASGWRVDVTDREGVHAAARRVAERWQRIDLVVNNAGISGPTVPLEAYDPIRWEEIIAINLIGAFNVCQAVVPYLRQSPAGRLVNIASLAGKEGTPNASAYSASKAALLALTKSLGKELAGTGVLVNAVAPAAIRTELLSQMTPEHVRTMVSKSPLQRLGEVEEVAELVAWLCSRSCTFNTGAVFDLSGGRATC